MPIGHWFRPPRHVPAIFMAVAIVSACALAWLMWSLLEQDKSVEMQRRQERLEQAADHATTIMQGALADLERASELPERVIRVHITEAGIDVAPPGHLLYYPQVARPAYANAGLFAEGEQAEFARNDLRSAATIYERIALLQDKNVRAGALARIARVRRKLREYDPAIRAYDQLLRLKDATVSGLPADLLAMDGQGSVLEEMHRDSDLRRTAEAMQKNLSRGHWQLTKSEFEFYSAEAKAWIGGDASAIDGDSMAQAEAVTWLWENRSPKDSSFRRLIATKDDSALIVARWIPDGLTAAVAGPTYLASLCRDAVPDSMLRCTLTDVEGRVVTGEAAPSRVVAIRSAGSARLPWTLEVFSSSDSAFASKSPRARLLWWVAVVLSVVWFTGAAFIVRAMGREARLAQLQSDFVSAVSHEFRSPLSSICQISEMLAADRLESDGARRQAYGVLERESERLRRLVEGLLDFQRLEAGANLYHFEPLEVGAFLKSIVADFQERVAAAGYAVELRASESAIYARADREALSRAIWNLLDNAVKYSPECRTVWVDLERAGNRISIAVRDRGLGIPSHEQRDIFEKFVRGGDSKARRIKGTGIGLAMVRHIIQAHGGKIELASKPGEGSRFTILIPEEAIS